MAILPLQDIKTDCVFKKPTLRNEQQSQYEKTDIPNETFAPL